MNCANHVDVPAVAYCRACGKPLCSVCTRDVHGVIYCEEHAASQAGGTMPPSPGQPGVDVAGTAPAMHGSSPGMAAILGLIPGVGAFYNGEYLKGFVHVGILAALIALVSHGYWPFAFGIAAWCVYMPIEAYHTAKARQMGVTPPDPLGLNRLLSPETARSHAAPAVNPGTNPAATAAGTAAGVPLDPQPYPEGSRAPIGAIILIILGVLFLANEFDWFHFDWGRFWPLILIAIGVFVLMKRTRRGW